MPHGARATPPAPLRLTGFHAGMENSPDPAPATLLLSVGGGVLRADPGWATLTGLEAGLLATVDVWDLVAAHDHETLRVAIERVVGGGGPVELTLAVRRGPSGVRPLAVELVHMDDSAAPVLALTHRSGSAPTPGMVHEAWRHGRLSLDAQPIYDSGGIEIIRHELLVRMRLRDGRILRAADFFGAAERLGLAVDIDCWVAGKALALLAADVGGTTALEVNVAGATVRQPAVLLRTLGLVLGASAVAPGRLMVALPGEEVTRHPEAARRLLVGLRALGVATALDHVQGTPEDLAVIDLLRFDTIKISGRLAAAAAGGEDGLARFVSVVEAAHRQSAEAAVASIDDLQTLRLARAEGADAFQGFQLAEPREADEL